MRRDQPSKVRRLNPWPSGPVFVLDPAGPKRTSVGDTTGDVADATGTVPTATRPAGCTWTPTPAGMGLTFTGSSAVGVSLGRPIVVTSPLSILFTVYLTTSNSGEKVIVTYGTGYSGNGFYCSNYSSCLYVTAGTSGISGPALSLGAVHNAAILHDSTGLTLYVDGKFLTGSIGFGTTAANLIIGGAPVNPASSFAGWMNNVAVFPRKLSVAEVDNYFADPLSGFRDRSHY